MLFKQSSLLIYSELSLVHGLPFVLLGQFQCSKKSIYLVLRTMLSYSSKTTPVCLSSGNSPMGRMMRY